MRPGDLTQPERRMLLAIDERGFYWRMGQSAVGGMDARTEMVALVALAGKGLMWSADGQVLMTTQGRSMAHKLRLVDQLTPPPTSDLAGLLTGAVDVLSEIRGLAAQRCIGETGSDLLIALQNAGRELRNAHRALAELDAQECDEPE